MMIRIIAILVHRLTWALKAFECEPWEPEGAGQQYPYSRSPKVGNPLASILWSDVGSRLN